MAGTFGCPDDIPLATVIEQLAYSTGNGQIVLLHSDQINNPMLGSEENQPTSSNVDDASVNGYVVSKREACIGLISAISYLQTVCPSLAASQIETLWSIVKFLDSIHDDVVHQVRDQENLNLTKEQVENNSSSLCKMEFTDNVANVSEHEKSLVNDDKIVGNNYSDFLHVAGAMNNSPVLSNDNSCKMHSTLECNITQHDQMMLSIDNSTLIDNQSTLNDDQLALNDDQLSLNNDQLSLNDDQLELNDDQLALNNNHPEPNDDQLELNDEKLALNDDRSALNDDRSALNDDQSALDDYQSVLHDDKPILHNHQLDLQDDQLPFPDVSLQEQENMNISRHETQENKNEFSAHAEVEAELDVSGSMTMPQELVLRESCVVEDNMGVFATTDVAEGTCFGPCESEMLRHIITASDMTAPRTCSHWMDMVRCTEDKSLHSLQAIRYGDDIFFEATVNIKTDNELLLLMYNSVVRDINTVLKIHTCHVCQLKFCKKAVLVKHLKTHNIKPNKCETCGKTFNSHSSINYHKKLHAGEKKFKCSICDKGFVIRSTLKHHMASHDEVKPYSCEVCGKTFSQKGNLLTHERVHTKEKPFICRVCGATYSHKKTLQSHMNRHSGEKKHQCTTCGKCFVRIDTMMTHMNIHTGEKSFDCKVCGKSFLQSSYLHGHMAVHSEDKKYLCVYCGRSFTRSQVLKKHIDNVHLDLGRAHICGHCDKTFKRRYHLKRHIDVTHKDLKSSKSQSE